jgi:hypothetical protein
MVFENFDQELDTALSEGDMFPRSPVRIPSPDVSRAVAKASLKLEQLSASFIVDASYFFHAQDPSWKWPNMTSLALAS